MPAGVHHSEHGPRSSSARPLRASGGCGSSALKVGGNGESGGQLRERTVLGVDPSESRRADVDRREASDSQRDDGKQEYLAELRKRLDRIRERQVPELHLDAHSQRQDEGQRKGQREEREEREERKKRKGQGRVDGEDHRRRLKRAWAAAKEVRLDSEGRVRRMCETLVTTSEAFLGLCALGTHGATTIGQYSMKLDEIQQTSPSGLGPRVGSGQDLLPIPIALARTFLTNEFCRDADAGDNRSAEVVEAALGSLAALNLLHGAGWTEHPIFPAAPVILGPGRMRTLRHLWTCSQLFVRKGATPFSLDEHRQALQDRAPDYAGGTVSVRRRLVADKVVPAWPKVGHACVAPIISLVDDELKAELESPDNILLPVSEWPLATPPSKVHASDDEWYAI